MVRVLWFAPRYNIAPTQRVPVIIEDAQGVRQVDLRWGFKSAWGNTLHINARAERIQTTATFKPLLHQRCLVPMDGFYEWKPDKSPVRFVRRQREVFYVAGLWADDPYRWGEAPDEPPKGGGRLQRTAREDARPTNLDGTSQSFVLLTTAAMPSVAPIHNRMPFIVRDDQLDRWLSDLQPSTAERSTFGLVSGEPRREQRPQRKPRPHPPCPAGTGTVLNGRFATMSKPQPTHSMFSAICRRVTVMVIVGFALTTAAQTNSLPRFAHWFIVPTPHLRPESSEPPASRSLPQDQPVSLNSLTAETGPADVKIERPDPFVSSTDRGDGDVRRYYLRQPDFGFVRTARVSDNLLVRSLDSVFRPEEFHIGRTTTLSCSILTAIKRRNPFCLLNPIILNVSW